jgi:hypothetical protein
MSYQHNNFYTIIIITIIIIIIVIIDGNCIWNGTFDFMPTIHIATTFQ